MSGEHWIFGLTDLLTSAEERSQLAGEIRENYSRSQRLMRMADALDALTGDIDFLDLGSLSPDIRTQQRFENIASQLFGEDDTAMAPAIFGGGAEILASGANPPPNIVTAVSQSGDFIDGLAELLIGDVEEAECTTSPSGNTAACTTVSTTSSIFKK